MHHYVCVVKRVRFGSRLRVRRALSSAAFACAIVLASVTTSIAATVVPVLAERHVYEYEGSASPGYLVWVSNSVDHPNHFNAYARPDGGSKFRLNPRGTQSTDASVDGTTAVYSQWNRDERDLWFYDLNTGHRTKLDPRVDSAYDESEPGLSGNHLFFLRTKPGGGRIRLIVYNLNTGSKRVVASASGYLISMQINGDWAVWDRCHVTRDYQYKRCNVFRYRISTRNTFRLPNPGKQQGVSAVTSDGTVYFHRVGSSEEYHCGLNVRVFRYPVGGPADLVASMPAGQDDFSAFAFEDAGSTTLYLNHVRCRSNEWDIYKIENADTT